ncbi:MAG: hypothetical protein OZSIB_2797 [Candidatus Ozemobacter sibiricus]|uniref:Uncharacterized protein n=1 Tax=Candidatus Ozemobacter sibiricus TaxID=2268124 RepID=A0A367ZT73_9BACT|nr:MAG: hypothetical protein OZSIB_2797 [Candidatus Ozemobacter sibiricus]
MDGWRAGRGGARLSCGRGAGKGRSARAGRGIKPPRTV